MSKAWRDGMLMGNTSEEAFFVKCDRDTMTQDDIDNGRLIAIVGFAPLKPQEFVVTKIQQMKSGTDVEELGG
jgi:phage tail sheath protein FI